MSVRGRSIPSRARSSVLALIVFALGLGLSALPAVAGGGGSEGGGHYNDSNESH